VSPNAPPIAGSHQRLSRNAVRNFDPSKRSKHTRLTSSQHPLVGLSLLNRSGTHPSHRRRRYQRSPTPSPHTSKSSSARISANVSAELGQSDRLHHEPAADASASSANSTLIGGLVDDEVAPRPIVAPRRTPPPGNRGANAGGAASTSTPAVACSGWTWLRRPPFPRPWAQVNRSRARLNRSAVEARGETRAVSPLIPR